MMDLFTLRGCCVLYGFHCGSSSNTLLFMIKNNATLSLFYFINDKC